MILKLILYVNKAGQDGVIPEPGPSLKKNLIPVPNPFIKFKPHLIRGGYPKKPASLPSLNAHPLGSSVIIDTRSSTIILQPHFPPDIIQFRVVVMHV